MTVQVEGMGVKIAVNGTEVSEVRFSDISSLEVAVTQTTSPPTTTLATPATTPTSTPKEQITPAVAVAGAVIVAIVAILALQRKK